MTVEEERQRALDLLRVDARRQCRQHRAAIILQISTYTTYIIVYR